MILHFAFFCDKADKAGKLSSGRKDKRFHREDSPIERMSESLLQHEESKCQKEAYAVMVTISKTVSNVGVCFVVFILKRISSSK